MTSRLKDTDLIFLPIFIAIGFVFCMFIVVPAIGQFPQTTKGEVTSVNQRSTLGVVTTTINFKDGSNLQVYGSYDISLGTHTFGSHSSWAWIHNLTKIDDEAALVSAAG